MMTEEEHNHHLETINAELAKLTPTSTAIMISQASAAPPPSVAAAAVQGSKGLHHEALENVVKVRTTRTGRAINPPKREYLF